MIKNEIIEMISDQNVRYIRLQFSDVHGLLKAVEVPVSQINVVFNNDVMFDGSSIQGLCRINESDMFLAPDLETFKVIPWETALDGSKVGLFICDILDINKVPFKGDPRNILKRQIKKMKNMGYDHFNIGLEPEFFMFEDTDFSNINIKLTDNNGYFDMPPLDRANECRREIVLNLEKMGFEIEASHHEVSMSQHEINFKFDSALTCCDNVQIFKLAVKTIAKKHLMTATFMPKPIYKINGSGMHCNVSLSKNGKNVFSKDNDLSDECNHFIAGVLKYACEFSAITNPLVNSYKRLVPGFEAPCYVAYSDANRSAMIRIPAARKEATRIEIRSVDACANPYLAIATILASGLYGIENKLLPGDSQKDNLFELSEKEIRKRNIKTLPLDLKSALKELESSVLLQEVLTKELHLTYIENKLMEYNEYQNKIHDWEIQNYLNRF